MKERISILSDDTKKGAKSCLILSKTAGRANTTIGVFPRTATRSDDTLQLIDLDL